jgi:dienelactone hydrolase
VSTSNAAPRAGYVHHPGEPVRGALDAVLPHEATGAELHLVFTDDGLYVPFLFKRPAGDGPFPTVICLHPGSGGLGLPYLADQLLEQSYLLDRLVEAGFAICVAEGRCEDEGAYGRDGVHTLDHDDVVAIFRRVAELPDVDAARVAFFGVSHGGEIQLKATSVLGGGPAALVPAEPAVIELLGLHYPGARIEAELQYRRDVTDDEIDLERALKRIARIPDDLPIMLVGRDDDHLQGLFRKAFELLQRAGKQVEWASFDHPEHAYQFGPRRQDGAYAPDAVTIQTADHVLAFLVERVRDA